MDNTVCRCTAYYKSVSPSINPYMCTRQLFFEFQINMGHVDTALSPEAPHCLLIGQCPSVNGLALHPDCPGLSNSRPMGHKCGLLIHLVWPAGC